MPLAPDHHVYIQQLYSRVLLDPGGADALGIAGDEELAGRLTVERDDTASRRAGSAADNRTISNLFDLLPTPSFAEKVEGTRAFFRALNAVGYDRCARSGRLQPSVPAYQALLRCGASVD